MREPTEAHPEARATDFSHRLPKKANWAAWSNSHMLKLRDAVALSLDFEPDSVSMEHREFATRLKVAVAHFRSRRILKLNMRTSSLASQHALTEVWVPHFAAWARVKPKWHLPPELAAIAQPRLSAAAREQAGSDQRRVARAGGWQEAVRQLASEMHLEDLKAGLLSSTKEIAERVAVAAAKLSIIGPRGELSAQNILRAALHGGRWTRPKAAKPKASQKTAAKVVGKGKVKPLAKAKAVAKVATKKVAKPAAKSAARKAAKSVAKAGTRVAAKPKAVAKPRAAGKSVAKQKARAR
jgi:hypothetical protein